MNVHCFINDGFPIIATASRADLTKDEAHGDLRYPIVHAVLTRRLLSGDLDEDDYEFFVDFQVIATIPPGEKLDYVDPNIEAVRKELTKFVSDRFRRNKFTMKINNEFYKMSDMSGTTLKTKYFLTPTI